MEVSVTAFPFPKIIKNIYLTLDMLMYIDHFEALRFMFSLNKHTRQILEKKIAVIQNGFVNDGLITYEMNILDNEYQIYRDLEMLYLKALKRNANNRILTIQAEFSYPENFKMFIKIIE